MVLPLALALAMQVAQTSVTGVVRDPVTGEALPGAVVSLADVERQAVTNELGRYTFGSVAPGPHHLSVHLDGFETRTLHALVPRSGRLEINVALQPDPIRIDGVQVSPRMALPGTEWQQDDPFSRELSPAAIRNHPLLAEADAFAALDGGEVYVQPESPTGIQIRGGAPDQTGYELDGIPVLSPYHAAGIFSAWNTDALSGIGISDYSYASSALSGIVKATTRSPGEGFRARSALSTTQARSTLDGPLAGSGFGYVISIRSGFPNDALRKADPNYLGNQIGDVLAKVEGPLFGGHLRTLFYQSESELTSASVVGAPPPREGGPARHGFEWGGESLGATWTRSLSETDLTISLWRATGHTEVGWSQDGEATVTLGDRRDGGLLALVETPWREGSLRLGVRTVHRATEFSHRGPDGLPTLEQSSGGPLVAAFVDRIQRLGETLSLTAGFDLTRALAGTYTSPRLSVDWTPTSDVLLSTSLSRRHQFTQSLRNTESIIANVLAADFGVGADGDRIPVSTSDEIRVAAAFRPTAGARLSASIYARRLDEVIQAAASTGQPVATDSITSGSGTVAGASFQGSLSGTRYGFLAGYGWQRVRLHAAESSYTPTHGVAHRAQGGVTLFPSPTLSIRLGLTGQWGRGTTPFEGTLEWEACNLLDLGCELGGTPRARTDALGQVALPAYLRADIGIRKHWHLAVGSVDGVLGLYGTITNVLNRHNVMNYGQIPEHSGPAPISMLPRAPLVIGLDWQF